MNTYHDDGENRSHLFAWNGLSFSIPRDWNLAAFDDSGRSVAVRMEDDTSIRLELEWTVAKRELNLARISQKYDRLTKPAREVAASADRMQDQPPGWTVTICTMADHRRLVIATHVNQQLRLCALFKLHLEPGGRRSAAGIISEITRSFEYRATGLIPWRVFDIAFDISHQWRLTRASFLAGRKMLAFEWRLRRLWLWTVSLADIALKNRSPSAWAAEFLNRSSAIKGPVFTAGDDDAIITRRTGGFYFGHFEELGRATMRYHARVRHDVRNNVLRLGVMNYRRAEDLALFPHDF